MNTNSVFSKDGQKSLKELYIKYIKEVWESEHMQKFCTNEVSVFIPFRDNSILITLDKPYIKKSFWFGYSDLGQGPSYEECNKSADNAENNAINYFISQNLKEINHNIKVVDNLLNGKNENWHKFCFDKSYDLESPNNPISYIRTVRYVHDLNKEMELTTEELTLYLEGLKEQRNIFIKRLNTYLKRYGVSKLSFDTYWMDR